MIALLNLNRLQRKVLLVIIVIIVVPMLITGWFSASWIAGRTDESIEHWIREAAQVNKDSLDRIHENSRLFADVLEESTQGELNLEAGQSPVPNAALAAGQAARHQPGAAVRLRQPADLFLASDPPGDILESGPGQRGGEGGPGRQEPAGGHHDRAHSPGPAAALPAGAGNAVRQGIAESPEPVQRPEDTTVLPA